MYFNSFPSTFYSLDNRASVQIVTNIFLRSVFTDELKNNFSVFDEYDIVDGETPEITAFKIYGNSELHWILLHLNDIIDPRYDWVLSQQQLKTYVETLYGSINAIHHYEDSDGNTIQANVILNSSSFTSFEPGDVLYNQSFNGLGYVTSKISNTQIIATVTQGGIQSGNQISNNIMGTNKANVTSTTIITGTAITNIMYEENKNEKKRRIRVLKPEFVQKIINKFQSKMNDINE